MFSISEAGDSGKVRKHVVSTEVKAVFEALHEQSWVAGVITVSPEELILFYGKDETARRLDFTSARIDQLENLSQACSPASFGLGDKDVMDSSVRIAGKLDIDQFASQFDLLTSGILETITSKLIPDKVDSYIRPEIYKLNVYGKGGFFKTHKDTPRGKNMFASLVIVLPSAHTGGDLILRHNGKTLTFNASSMLSTTSHDIAYVAFFSDVDHEVMEVTSGYRVTLTYNLFLESGKVIAKNLNVEITDGRLREALEALIRSPEYDNTKFALLFGLSHQYPFGKSDPGKIDEKLEGLLKGSDASLYRVLKNLSRDVSLRMIYKVGNDVAEEYNHLFLTTYRWGGTRLEMPDREIMRLLSRLGGEIRRSSNNPYSWEFDVAGDNSYELGVKWVSQDSSMFSQSRVEDEYVYMGNQASLETLYGDVVLFVTPRT